jgi:hypothetical protein
MEFVLALKVMANGAGLPTTGKDSPVSSPALLTAHLEIVVGGRILAQEAGTAPEKNFLGTGRGGKKIRALRAKIFRAATNYRWSDMLLDARQATVDDLVCDAKSIQLIRLTRPGWCVAAVSADGGGERAAAIYFSWMVGRRVESPSPALRRRSQLPYSGGGCI